MRNTRLVSAGLLDSGLASLATFGIGLYAARMLDAEVLGVYALFFSAFVMASAVAAKLFYVPAEAWVISTYDDGREVLFSQMLKVLPLTLVVSPLITGLALLLVPEIDTAGVVVGIAVTTALCGMISPLQDHCRRTLHIAAMSPAAAVVSGVQLLGAVAAMVILHVQGVEGVDPVWGTGHRKRLFTGRRVPALRLLAHGLSRSARGPQSSRVRSLAGVREHRVSGRGPGRSGHHRRPWRCQCSGLRGGCPCGGTARSRIGDRTFRRHEPQSHGGRGAWG